MTTPVSNIGKVIKFDSNVTTGGIMTMVRDAILTYFGEGIAAHDAVSTTKVVFKVQNGLDIPFYFFVEVTSTTALTISSIYRYWDAATHVGSGIITDSGMTLSLAGYLYVFACPGALCLGRADGGLVTGHTGVWLLLGCRPTFYPSAHALTTAAVIAGSAVAVPVDNTANFFVGMHVAYADKTAAGWGYGTVTAVAPGSVTLDALSVNLDVGSFVGIPTGYFLQARGVSKNVLDEASLVASPSFNALTSTSIRPLYNPAAFGRADGVSSRHQVSPPAWYSSLGSVLLDMDALVAPQVMGTDNGFMVINDDFSVEVSGVATGGSTTTLIDRTHLWTADALVGKYLAVSGGSNTGFCRKIVSNTDSVVTVDYPFAAAIDTTSVYAVADAAYRYVKLGTGDVQVLMREAW